MRNAVEESAIGIGIKYDNGFIYPSSLSKYIKREFRRKSKSLNTQKVAAEVVCKFLNYCLEQIKEEHKYFLVLKEKGMFSLNLAHGSAYISFLSIRNKNEEVSKNYVQREIFYLNRFYKWLHNENIIDISEDLLEKQDIFDASYLDTIYPNRHHVSRDKLVDFGQYRYELTKDFLSLAKQNYPHCYFAFCLQFFGGLRKGEVVNLKTDSLVYNDSYAYVMIRNNSEELFPNESNSKNQVKKPRNQGLIRNSILNDAYGFHKRYIKRFQNEEKALFVSPRTKKPLNGSSLTTAFNHTKELLLEKLSEENRVNEYLFLSKRPWSTHVGRGVFTNFCFDKGMTITEVAIARGDSNIQSVIHYIDKENVKRQMQEGLDNLVDSNVQELLHSKGEILFD